MVAAHLRSLGLSPTTGIAGTGVTAMLKGLRALLQATLDFVAGPAIPPPAAATPPA